MKRETSLQIRDTPTISKSPPPCFKAMIRMFIRTDIRKRFVCGSETTR